VKKKQTLCFSGSYNYLKMIERKRETVQAGVQRRAERSLRDTTPLSACSVSMATRTKDELWQHSGTHIDLIQRVAKGTGCAAPRARAGTPAWSCRPRPRPGHPRPWAGTPRPSPPPARAQEQPAPTGEGRTAENEQWHLCWHPTTTSTLPSLAPHFHWHPAVTCTTVCTVTCYMFIAAS